MAFYPPRFATILFSLGFVSACADNFVSPEASFALSTGSSFSKDEVHGRTNRASDAEASTTAKTSHTDSTADSSRTGTGSGSTRVVPAPKETAVGSCFEPGSFSNMEPVSFQLLVNDVKGYAPFVLADMDIHTKSDYELLKSKLTKSSLPAWEALDYPHVAVINAGNGVGGCGPWATTPQLATDGQAIYVDWRYGANRYHDGDSGGIGKVACPLLSRPVVIFAYDACARRGLEVCRRAVESYM